MSDELFLNEGVYDPHAFKCVFFVGGPGAGKTTVERSLGLQNVGMKMMDIDKIVYYLKNLHSIPADEIYSNIGNKSLDIQKIYAQQHFGVIIQSTGRKTASILKMLNIMHENYYDCFMVFVDVDGNIAMERIIQREKHKGNVSNYDIGRATNLDYAKTAYNDTKNNFEFYKKLFGNNFCVVKNNEKITQLSLKDARNKINSFLSAPLNDEAKTFLKGIKKNNQFLGRNTGMSTE